MKKLKLHGKWADELGLVSLVDEEDYDFVNQWKWTAAKNCGSFVAQRCALIDKKYKTILLHRLIMGATLKEQEVDHKDRNRLNNQKSNLRICTRHQNILNRYRPHASSKYAGVHKRHEYKEDTWKAVIKLNGVVHYLGQFTNEEEAARAYDAKAKELFGEFAYLNFPEKENPTK